MKNEDKPIVMVDIEPPEAKEEYAKMRKLYFERLDLQIKMEKETDMFEKTSLQFRYENVKYQLEKRIRDWNKKVKEEDLGDFLLVQEDM